ncbi:unnamed protein product, partial [Prorocentrum cordatum]
GTCSRGPRGIACPCGCGGRPKGRRSTACTSRGGTGGCRSPPPPCSSGSTTSGASGRTLIFCRAFA